MNVPGDIATGDFDLFKNNSGFTLIELVIAMVISTLVIGILSVCLSFSLRAWESTQNRKTDHTAAFVDLLKQQLSEFSPTPVKFEDGLHPVFKGTSKSVVFATLHSVKAISHGVPVVARYIYDPGSRILYYSEMPLDPYHSKSILDFMQAKDSRGDRDKEKYRSYPIELAGFTLSFSGKEGKQFEDAWDHPDEAPVEILLSWAGEESAISGQVLMLNSPFTIDVDKAAAVPGTVQPGAGLQND
jgi:prepilin-type N-terminal cleavage/methylation domain-containing protein